MGQHKGWVGERVEELSREIAGHFIWYPLRRIVNSASLRMNRSETTKTTESLDYSKEIKIKKLKIVKAIYAEGC